MTPSETLLFGTSVELSEKNAEQLFEEMMEAAEKRNRRLETMVAERLESEAKRKRRHK